MCLRVTRSGYAIVTWRRKWSNFSSSSSSHFGIPHCNSPSPFRAERRVRTPNSLFFFLFKLEHRGLGKFFFFVVASAISSLLKNVSLRSCPEPPNLTRAGEGGRKAWLNDRSFNFGPKKAFPTFHHRLQSHPSSHTPHSTTVSTPQARGRDIKFWG